MLDVKKMYYNFCEKYPSYAKDIIDVKEGKGNSLKFKMKDGKTAWYYPLKKDIIYYKKDKN